MATFQHKRRGSGAPEARLGGHLQLLLQAVLGRQVLLLQLMRLRRLVASDHKCQLHVRVYMLAARRGAWLPGHISTDHASGA